MALGPGYRDPACAGTRAIDARDQPSRLPAFLPSANQALAELEEATGKPVQLMEDPQLNVLATIRRAGAGEASHVLRIKGGENQAADYLIVFQCRMALRDRPGPHRGAA
ncbi:MAG: hypothetical protein WAM11_02315 [Cyanobium sp.]